MPLSQAQHDYIVTTTNERGAAHVPAVVFDNTLSISDIYLNIGGNLAANPLLESHGYTRKDTTGCLRQSEVTPDFTALVEKTITGMLRHF
jgi:hypothetical protein